MAYRHQRAGQARLSLAFLPAIGLLGVCVALAAQTRAGGPPAELPHDRAAAKGVAGTLDLIVTYETTPGHFERERVARLGGQTRRAFRNFPALAVSLPSQAVERLAASPGVARVSPDRPVRGTMDVARPTAGLTQLATGSALTGAGVTIAVVDSGVAPHPDLAGRLLAQVDFVDGAEGMVDPNGHGTHVAGIAAGDGAGSSGLYSGVAPGASIVSVRVLDAAGAGQTSDVIAGLDWILQNKDALGIRIVNLSLGHPVYESVHTDPLVLAVEQVWQAGLVVVCSAGNHGRNGHFTINSPGNSPLVVTVGALTDANTATTLDDFPATYSAKGPTGVDQIHKPDLLAPGNKIVSLRSAGSDLDTRYADWRVSVAGGEAEYFQMSGTSMATPLVAGAVALMLEQDPSASPETIKARLVRSSRKLSGDPFISGAGVIDVAAALADAGWTANSPSPKAFRDDQTGRVGFENTALLWNGTAWSLTVLWSETVLWSDVGVTGDTVLWSDAIASGDTVLWSDTAVFADTVLWSDSVLEANTVLWSDSMPAGGD